MTTTIEPETGSAVGLLLTAAADVAERLQRSVVAVRSPRGGGAGTIWRDDGLVITNSHVVAGERAEVITWDERAFAANVVARDPERDLAALRVTVEGLPAAEIGDSSAVRVGQIALAVGNPWGQRGHVTAGIIFSIGGASAENRVPLPEAIRADVRLAPGNSGGPLADARGRVIGINAMIAGGMAVAVPSNTAARFASGDAPGQGYLGISAQPVPLPARDAIAAGLVDGEGLMLTDIVPESPAARAGLLPGDVLVGVGEQGRGIPGTVLGLRRLRPGVPVRLAVLRAGTPRFVNAVPVART
jgi:serine protease Do